MWQKITQSLINSLDLRGQIVLGRRCPRREKLLEKTAEPEGASTEQTSSLFLAPGAFVATDGNRGRREDLAKLGCNQHSSERINGK